MAAGAFWFLSANLGRALAQWRDRVRVIVYLKAEAAAPDALVARVQEMSGVASARYVSKADALALLRNTLGPEASVADHLTANPLPASLEITPSPERSSPRGGAGSDGGTDRPHGGGGSRGGHRMGGAPGPLATTPAGHQRRHRRCAGRRRGSHRHHGDTLVLHTRRHEIEIMRLVGAPEFTIRLPLVLQGGAQGLLGGMLALVVLAGFYRVLAPRLETLVSVTLGLPQLSFLTPATVLGLVVIGTLLGGVGGVLARSPRDSRA